ncbi:MAG TPA: LysR family transcriptional regulator [Desulfobacteria bacterium]|nr:LysR family transcriptional regulator [Desulfobacteria bacterium]
MDWQQLYYFQTVARLQHFTRAAEKLSISQPALSRSIARLEEDLGVPLFERQGRNVALNRYGRVFLKRVNRALQEISEGQREIQDLISPSHGSVALAFIHTLGTNLVPDLLRRFRKSYPNIAFQLSQNITRVILDQLINAEIDFCFCSPTVTEEGIHCIRLLTEELFVIVPREHRLANQGSIDLAEIADDPFIALKQEAGLREITDRLCRKAGFVPKITFEGEEVTTIAGLVAAKLGVAIIPQITGLDMTKVALLKVNKPVCRRAIGMAWVEGRYLSPAAQQFRQFTLDYFAKPE